MRLLPFHYAARNIGRSPLRLWLTAGGSAIVVFLVVAAVASMRALDRGVRESGTAGNVMLLGAGSEESVERSEISASTPGVIAASVEGVRSAAGAPFISPELHVPLPLRREGTPAPSGSSRMTVSHVVVVVKSFQMQHMSTEPTRLVVAIRHTEVIV